MCLLLFGLTLDERVAEAAEHEFDMEMTGVAKVDAILTASSIVLEVYKTNLVAEQRATRSRPSTVPGEGEQRAHRRGHRAR